MARYYDPRYAPLCARYPRLARAMQWACVMCENEVEATLRCLKRGQTGPSWGPEAAVHVGGPAAVLRHAWQCRHLAR
jgi:hypothetical protein